uniref:Fe2OG dioxygenase domain-containing protein n=1 Tax=Chromera velia CCMP2878 TaxID=1169474 RepID=A0A0G4I839_9ALVE|eukprot:Cvel_11758.t1-p1 / transcript=Cvel_11758.t1 / gene=Cvel_11758 / organism=Chromera_velia_CCMP2878 / gene_product=hypothetical protein / transcript_product=hypothetical protein / location=Cvel_scaffold747:34653-37291(-) / protein_length=383 / sequence_SO=supercontig / SO=protein_coding / is_pseudo=false
MTSIEILPVSERPPHFPCDRSDQEPNFDPAVHLKLTNPSSVTTLDFHEISVEQVPKVSGSDTSQVAVTSAFSVLSDAGVRAIRKVIANHGDLESSNKRIHRCIRGMAYSSDFVRKFNECPQLLEHLSRLAGMPLVPHYMHASYSHTNLSSEPSAQKVVDSWHVDSCPFVLVVVCSDLEDMQGGVLQAVKRRGREAATALVEATGNSVGPEDLVEMGYASQGWGLFMQGSEILHRVTPVTRSKEPRITVVNGYMPANAFVPDRTAPGSFLYGIDGRGGFVEAPYEFSRGRAFRALKQLESFVSSSFERDPKVLANKLQLTVDELVYTIEVLRGSRREHLGYLDDNSGATEGVQHVKDGSDATTAEEDSDGAEERSEEGQGREFG